MFPFLREYHAHFQGQYENAESVVESQQLDEFDCPQEEDPADRVPVELINDAHVPKNASLERVSRYLLICMYPTNHFVLISLSLHGFVWLCLEPSDNVPILNK